MPGYINLVFFYKILNSIQILIFFFFNNKKFDFNVEQQQDRTQIHY